MKPEEMLFISGASMSDTLFTQDRTTSGETTCWNVTRATQDALDGKFGPPIKRAFRDMPAMTAAERKNIDWDKVAKFSRDSARMAKPAIAVDVDAGMEVHRIVIDGNHRISARELRGLPFFELYVIPEHLEPLYRVTFRDGKGKPLNPERFTL